jgi:hypothetical protein
MGTRGTVAGGGQRRMNTATLIVCSASAADLWRRSTSLRKRSSPTTTRRRFARTPSRWAPAEDRPRAVAYAPLRTSANEVQPSDQRSTERAITIPLHLGSAERSGGSHPARGACRTRNGVRAQGRRRGGGVARSSRPPAQHRQGPAVPRANVRRAAACFPRYSGSFRVLPGRVEAAYADRVRRTPPLRRAAQRSRGWSGRAVRDVPYRAPWRGPSTQLRRRSHARALVRSIPP